MTALGGIALHALLEGEKLDTKSRLVMMTHSIRMFLILSGGFDMLAGRTFGWPGWAITKMVIWALFGGATALLYRNATLNRPAWLLDIL